MSVVINVGVRVMVFVINWTIGMGRSAEKIHYFLQIYILLVETHLNLLGY